MSYFLTVALKKSFAVTFAANISTSSCGDFFFKWQPRVAAHDSFVLEVPGSNQGFVIRKELATFCFKVTILTEMSSELKKKIECKISL